MVCDSGDSRRRGRRARTSTSRSPAQLVHLSRCRQRRAAPDPSLRVLPCCACSGYPPGTPAGCGFVCVVTLSLEGNGFSVGRHPRAGRQDLPRRDEGVSDSRKGSRPRPSVDDPPGPRTNRNGAPKRVFGSNTPLCAASRLLSRTSVVRCNPVSYTHLTLPTILRV